MNFEHAFFQKYFDVPLGLLSHFQNTCSETKGYTEVVTKDNRKLSFTFEGSNNAYFLTDFQHTTNKYAFIELKDTRLYA